MPGRVEKRPLYKLRDSVLRARVEKGKEAAEEIQRRRLTENNLSADEFNRVHSLGQCFVRVNLLTKLSEKLVIATGWPEDDYIEQVWLAELRCDGHPGVSSRRYNQEVNR